MNVKKCLCFTVITGALAIGAVTLQAVNNKGVKIPAHSTENYSLSLSLSNVPGALVSDYQNSFSGNVKTALNHDVNLTFVNARTGFDDLGLDEIGIELAPHGMIHNLNNGNTQITGINGIKFTGEGSLLFKPAIHGEAGKGGLLPAIAPIEVSAGSADFVSVPLCDYFELEAGDSGAMLEDLAFSYSCDAEAYDVRMLNGTYTGIGSDSSTYKMTVTNGAGSIESLDKVSNIQLSGTAAMTSKTSVRFTFVFNTYNIFYDMNYDGHALTFVAKSDEVGGAAASQVAEVNLNRVYNVEDFGSYSATGQGYTSATKKYETTGLRAKIYADYYTGSSSGEIGGNGWPIMTSTDNTTLLKTKGHNGQGGAFKFSNGTSMRYISMNELYGVKQVIGKGSVLSFWARGAYTNGNFNVDHANNTPMKFYAYYDTPLTPSTQETVRETFDFTVQAGATWQHFEMPLTSGRTYYGFGFYAKQSSGSTQYVPIDDIQIYTASPYAEYTAPVAATGVSVSPSALELTTGHTGEVVATVAPDNATNKNVAWSSNNTGVATVNNGVVTAVSAGNATITATTEDGGFTATCAVTVSDPEVFYPEGTFMGDATVLGNNWKIIIALGNQSNGLVAIRLANTDAQATGVTFNSSTNEVSITTTGSYSSYTFGTVSGTYDPSNDRIVNISCDGTIGSYVSNNGSITATRPSNLYDCDGTTSQLQSQFKRRYMSGSWQVDNSNADRITSNTTEFVSGTGSVKRRGYSGGAVALNFNSDFSPAKTVASIQYWVYNPSGSDITLRMWGYKATGFGSNFETGTVTAKAGQWTYVAMGFTSAAIYNFQIADFNNTGAYLSFDNILFF